MASYKTAFGSYIKAEDLQGRAVIVNIESIALEELGKDGKSEKKLVARFVGKDKSLILNRTNADALAYTFNTDDFDRWRGNVVLYPDTTMYGGKRVACVRVKPVDAQQGQGAASAGLGGASSAGFDPRGATGAPTAEPAPITDDDIPF